MEQDTWLKCTQFSQDFDVGDTIGVLFDLTSQRLLFTKNGFPFGESNQIRCRQHELKMVGNIKQRLTFSDGFPEPTLIMFGNLTVVYNLGPFYGWNSASFRHVRSRYGFFLSRT